MVLVMSSVSSIDATADEMLVRVNHQLTTQGIVLHLVEVKGLVLDRLTHGELFKVLSGYVYLSTYLAFTALSGSE